MGLGEIFSESWREYESNFKAIFRVMLVYVAVPALFIYFFSLFLLVSDAPAEVSSIFDEDIVDEIFPVNIRILMTVFSIIAIVLSYFSFVGLAAESVSAKKFSYESIVHNGKKWFWLSLGFFIVAGVFLLGLFALLIIPGIIFSIYWIFAYYAFIDEKKGIVESLKRSYHIVKGRWWNTLGYALLMGLIVLGISIVFSIPDMVFGVISVILSLGGSFPMAFFVITDAVSELVQIAGAFVTTPLSIIFFKNFYLAMKKEKEGRKKHK